jgi:TfoX/Sxy family transcriptional regulator of competence genes
VGFDEGTAQRVRDTLGHATGLTERKMFGGVAFMLDGNMCCGVIEQDLVVRVGPEHYDEMVREPHARPMDFTGRSLRGFVYVAPAGFDTETALEQWIARGVDFVRTLPAKR